MKLRCFNHILVAAAIIIFTIVAAGCVGDIPVVNESQNQNVENEKKQETENEEKVFSVECKYNEYGPNYQGIGPVVNYADQLFDGGMVLLTIKGKADRDVNKLYFSIVDCSCEADYWKNITDGGSFYIKNIIAGEEFQAEFEIPIIDTPLIPAETKYVFRSDDSTEEFNLSDCSINIIKVIMLPEDIIQQQIIARDNYIKSKIYEYKYEECNKIWAVELFNTSTGKFKIQYYDENKIIVDVYEAFNKSGEALKISYNFDKDSIDHTKFQHFKYKIKANLSGYMETFYWADEKWNGGIIKNYTDSEGKYFEFTANNIVENDGKLFFVPSEVGRYIISDVTVTSLDKTQIAKLGKIVMSDGLFLESESFSSYSGSATPIGIICKVNADGKTGLMLGLCNSSSDSYNGYMQWAPRGTTGYITNFTSIQGTYYDGDIDGSDNWEEICKVDPVGTANPATNYPAFNYVLTYAATAGLEKTEYADNWYMPSAYELYIYLYKNKEILNTSLTTAGGTTLKEYSWYWASSQTDENSFYYQDWFGEDNSDYYAKLVTFDNGYVYNSSKNNGNYVCCIRAF